MSEFKNFKKCPDCGTKFDRDEDVDIQIGENSIEITFSCGNDDCRFVAEGIFIPTDFDIPETYTPDPEVWG